MYISPYIVGAGAVIVLEMVLLICYSIIHSKEDK